jgi:hypothetical protein
MAFNWFMALLWDVFVHLFDPRRSVGAGKVAVLMITASRPAQRAQPANVLL